MATYYIDGKNGNDKSGNGNSNNPWKTFGKAESSVKPGDTVKVRTGLYRELITLDVNNTTWQADDGHQPVVDGGYNEGLFSGGQLPPPDGYLPGSKNANLVRVRGDNITVDGLTIQNAAGRAMACSGNRCTVRNCKIDFCYGTGIAILGGDRTIASPLIENNTITRTSMMYYHPGRDGNAAAGCMIVIRTENAIIRHNIVAYGFGEGINCDKNSVNMLVEGNVVHTCNHVHLYIMRSQNTTIRNNFVYHLYLKPHLGGSQRPPAGIAIGDESGRIASGFDHSRGATIYNNIVVGMGINFHVRNNEQNYDTQLLDTYVASNTFVAGALTRASIDISGNLNGRPHQRTIFENNIILGGKGSISVATGNLSGITFRNNLWSSTPNPAMRGPGDRIGDPRLANPDAPLNGTSPGPTNADPFNYRLTKNSTLAIGTAGEGGNVGGFRPPKIETDFFNANRDNNPDIGAHEYGGQTATISANFSIGPGQQSGVVPHTVDFVDRSTSDATITKWLWEFGDGSTSTDRNPSHTYIVSGSFTVKLTIEDQKGQTDSIVEPQLITSLPEGTDMTPESFRRFLLVEDATENILAFGIQYPDLSCVLLWNQEPFHILNYANIDDVAQANVEEGLTSLFWLDPTEQPVVGDELQRTEDELVLQ